MLNQRAALVFSGQLRSFSKCYANIQKNVLNVLKRQGIQFDIYFHVWKDEDRQKIKYLKKVWPRARVVQTTLPSNIFDARPWAQTISVGRGSGISSTPQERDRMYRSLCYQWCGVARAFDFYREVREKEGKSYDWVFRCRPDVIYDKKLRLPSSPSKAALYVGPKHRFVRSGRPTNVNNIYAYGSQSTMDIYGSFYHRLEEVFNALAALKDGDADSRLRENYSLNN
jgi:hypothetical protein